MIARKQANIKIIKLKLLSIAIFHVRKPADFMIKLHERIVIKLMFLLFINAIKKIGIIVISKILLIKIANVTDDFFFQKHTARWRIIHFFNCIVLAFVFFLNANMIGHTAINKTKFSASPPD